jgi:primosomal protein N' (replication factor Y)
MTYHASVDRAICHYCGNTLIKPKVCPRCGSQDLKKIGTGTQKLEEQLIQDFPGARVVRMDADTTSEKNGYEKVLNNFAGADILVGTQMIAKGHDFPKVTLVGIISADSLISMEDYRAEERGFQLMTQVAGRAGRQELEGRVIIQAYNVEDYAITAASRHNYDEFYGNEIKIRKTLNYPPFCHLACVSMWGEDDRAVYEACLKYRTEIFALLQNVPHVEILGPTRPFVPKINNKYKWRLILKAVDEAVLINLLSENSVPKLKGISYSLDVNPGFML